MQRVDGDECYSKVKEAVAFQHITGWAHEGDLSVRTTFIWVFAGFQYGNDEGFFFQLSGSLALDIDRLKILVRLLVPKGTRYSRWLIVSLLATVAI